MQRKNRKKKTYPEGNVSASVSQESIRSFVLLVFIDFLVFVPPLSDSEASAFQNRKKPPALNALKYFLEKTD